MGRSHLLSSLLGLILVIAGSPTLCEEEVPMRMADESLVVPNYSGSEGAASAQSTVTVSPEDGQEYQIYQGVMGRPGVDFPVHPSIPATSFSCRDIKQSGYYADLETDCQVFHICDGGRKISFICPNGTIFRQSHLICDWWFRVDCGKSVELYEESAEQLAADQKVYKERSDERERRKKLVRERHGEQDIYALDEPYLKPTTTLRQSSVERKSERNSKRVMDADFSNMYPGRQSKAIDEVRERSGILSGANERFTTQKITSPTPSPSIFTTKSRFSANIDNFQQSASGSFVNNFHHKTQHVFAVEKSLFSTTTPKAFTSQATTLTTTTTRVEEPERQQLAESASFASHRNSRTFADQSNPNLLRSALANFLTTTSKAPSTVFKNAPRKPSKGEEFAFANADKNYKLKKTEERLKYIPLAPTAPAYKPTVPTIQTPSTTPFSTTYTSARGRIPVDDVYFTTAIPETSSPLALDVPKIKMASNNPEVDFSLQELDIHKTTIEPPTTRRFTEETRDGLSVPPSLGPTALRSFALYFAGSEDDAQKFNNARFLPENVLIIPIRQNVGRKVSNKPNVLQQVDDIVKENKNSTKIQSPQPSPNSLPSSLTPQTKNSFNALFERENKTTSVETQTESEIGTTSLDSITELPVKINTVFQGNDLSSSQSRGIVEPELKTNQIDERYNRVAPDLRELAQVFTKALSAYLDDPQAFRRVLSEIRPTEPSPSTEVISASPIEYPSATQEEDEVLDFSDVTKPSKKRGSTEAYTETTTELPETTTTIPVEISNYVLPLSVGLNTSETRYPQPDTDLTAPFESLDQSQSSYYTPPPYLEATTNAIAEEINNEFSPDEDKLPEISSNEAVDSYVPVYGSVDDESRPRYGGFQNNSRANYSPYGSELTTTPAPDEIAVTTFNPRNRTSALFSRLKEEEAARQNAEELALVKELNNLAYRPTPLPLSINTNDGNKLQQAETRAPTARPFNNLRSKSKVQEPSTTLNPLNQEPNPEEINLELSPPFETEPPQGFFVTYTLVNGELQTNRPKTTYLPEDFTTTMAPEITERATTQLDQTETYIPTTVTERRVPSSTPIYITRSTTTTTTTTTTPAPTTSTTPIPSRRRGKTGKSLERLMELQETLMFNTTHVSTFEKEKAREMVQEAMHNMTMNDLTTTTLTKMMELAAKNETYRRLVLLLVNDRSGKNKTVEEARLSLLRALLTPVINQNRPRTTSSVTELPAARARNFRRGKNIQQTTDRTTTTQIMRRVTTANPAKVYRKTTVRPRVVKTTEAPTTTTQKPSTVIGNLGLIRKTIEDSKTKEIRVNSLDDAILDSDSRAIELLRSLYSLAARWG